MNQSVIAVLQLLRVPNLLLLAAAVYIYTNRILLLPLAEAGIYPLMAGKDFWLFLFIVICVCAAGYVHNDILDLNTDKINNKRGFIGKQISKPLAWGIYCFFLLAPIPFVYSLSIEVRNLRYLNLYFLVHLSLFLYNALFKRLPLLGNLIVATLSAALILLPYIVESSSLQELQNMSPHSYHKVSHITYVFVGFTFMAHLIREIVKDAQDKTGDKQNGFYTLPLLIRPIALNILLSLLQLAFIILICYWIFTTPYISGHQIIHLVLLCTPLLINIFFTARAGTVNDYSIVSNILKFLMLTGIISLYIISI